MSAAYPYHRIDSLRAPLLVSWQLTRDCDLCCLHCCTESAPGKRLPDELDEAQALQLAAQIVGAEVPYVMLCGGEPLLVPHFLRLAERLGRAGVQLKIESNGQRLERDMARRLAALPVRSVQISLDADSPSLYAQQRPGGSLPRAWDACRAVREAGVPLEITFAPTRLNIHEIEAVIERALQLGAFRLSTGQLMRIGTAARLWQRLQPDAAQYHRFRATLQMQRARLAGRLELCFEPFTLAEALQAQLHEPPATLLVLPNGAVKVAAALPYLCADLRRETLFQAWCAYQRAWHHPALNDCARQAAADETSHGRATAWRMLDPDLNLVPDGTVEAR